jgi:hypothetical protein
LRLKYWQFQHLLSISLRCLTRCNLQLRSKLCWRSHVLRPTTWCQMTNMRDTEDFLITFYLRLAFLPIQSNLWNGLLNFKLNLFEKLLMLISPYTRLYFLGPKKIKKNLTFLSYTIYKAFLIVFSAFWNSFANLKASPAL